MQAVIPDKGIDMRREVLLTKLENLKKVRKETEHLGKGTGNRELRLQAINSEILKIARQLEYIDRNK